MQSTAFWCATISPRRFGSDIRKPGIYGGTPAVLGAAVPVLAYNDHDIRFKVSAPSYNDMALHQGREERDLGDLVSKGVVVVA